MATKCLTCLHSQSAGRPSVGGTQHSETPSRPLMLVALETARFLDISIPGISFCGSPSPGSSWLVFRISSLAQL